MRVIELALPWAVNRSAFRNTIGTAEGSQRSAVARVEAHDQDVAAGRHGHSRRESEVHRIAQAPRVGEIRRIKKLHAGTADVLQLDELIFGVVPEATVGEHIRRMIHDLADDNRADSRTGIGGPESGARLGHEALLAGGENVSSEGYAIEGRTEVEAMNVTSQVSSAVAGEQVDLIAGGTERKARRGVGRRVELALVEREVAVGRNGGAIWNPELLRIAEVVRQIPVADVRRGIGEIAQFNGVTRRLRIAVGESFIDDHLRDTRRAVTRTRRAIQRTARPPAGGKAPSANGSGVINDHQ